MQPLVDTRRLLEHARVIHYHSIAPPNQLGDRGAQAPTLVGVTGLYTAAFSRLLLDRRLVGYSTQGLCAINLSIGYQP